MWAWGVGSLHVRIDICSYLQHICIHARANLQFCTKQQSNQSSILISSLCMCVCVCGCRRTQRFEAHIWTTKKQIYLGGYSGAHTARGRGAACAVARNSHSWSVGWYVCSHCCAACVPAISQTRCAGVSFATMVLLQGALTLTI